MTRIAGYAQIAFGVVSIALIVLSLVSLSDVAAISVGASLHDTYFLVPNLFAVGWELTGSLLLIFGGLLLRKRPMAAE